MKKIAVLMTTGSLILLSACSRDYTPVAGTSGEEIFKAACMECHEAIEGKQDIYYELKPADQTLTFFTDKVSSGSLLMPKFPNIKGEELKAVGQYALEHSQNK